MVSQSLSLAASFPKTVPSVVAGCTNKQTVLAEQKNKGRFEKQTTHEVCPFALPFGR